MSGLNGWQQTILVTLRFAIGWHLLVLGYGRLASAAWLFETQLRAATGPVAPIFHWLAGVPWLRGAADHAAIWGAMTLGLLLMVGLFTRTATVLASALLAASVLAQPPLPVSGTLAATLAGHEMYVNRTVIEILALVVSLSFDTGRIAGLDLLLLQRRPAAAEPAPLTPPESPAAQAVTTPEQPAP
jgi:thiosulfate dehydrogenase (quinone) large subunit